MLFQFGFYSSLLLIFFVHGLVYALMLWRKSITNESASDAWLSAFLFLCISYIAPWMLGFGGWYDEQPYRDILFYVPFQHLYFIGPVIFFYVQSLLNPSFRFTRKHWLHFIPGILYLLYSLVIVVTDKLILHRYYFLADGSDRDFDTWYQLTGFVSMIIYFLLAYRYYNLYKKILVQVVSYAEFASFRWIRNFLLVFLLMLIVRSVFFVLSVTSDMDYQDNWWNFISFALLYYYIAINGYSNAVIAKVRFRAPALLSFHPRVLLEYSAAENEEAEIIIDDKTEDTTLLPAADADVARWKDKVFEAVVTLKGYEAPELSLTDLAKQLGTNPSLLSKVINRGFEMNFNDFVNYHRVQAVIEKLKAGEHRSSTLLGIAFDCGFNSKATFNRAFKRVTNEIPKDYLRKI